MYLSSLKDDDQDEGGDDRRDSHSQTLFLQSPIRGTHILLYTSPPFPRRRPVRHVRCSPTLPLALPPITHESREDPAIFD